MGGAFPFPFKYGYATRSAGGGRGQTDCAAASVHACIPTKPLHLVRPMPCALFLRGCRPPRCARLLLETALHAVCDGRTWAGRSRALVVRWASSAPGRDISAARLRAQGDGGRHRARPRGTRACRRRPLLSAPGAAPVDCTGPSTQRQPRRPCQPPCGSRARRPRSVELSCTGWRDSRPRSAPRPTAGGLRLVSSRSARGLAPRIALAGPTVAWLAAALALSPIRTRAPLRRTVPREVPAQRPRSLPPIRMPSAR